MSIEKLNIERFMVLAFFAWIILTNLALLGEKKDKKVLLAEVCRQSQGYKEIGSSLEELIKNSANYTMEPVEFTIEVGGKKFTCTIDLDKAKTENPLN